MWHLRRQKDRQPIFRLGPHRRAPNPPLMLSGKSLEATDVALAALEALPHLPGEDRGGRRCGICGAGGTVNLFSASDRTGAPPHPRKH